MTIEEAATTTTEETTSQFDFLSGAADTLSDMFSNFASFEGAMAVCIGVGIFAFLILGLFGKNYSMWHVLGGAVAGFCAYLIVSGATGLYDWLKLGFEFTNLAASLFALGVLWCTLVLGWNLIATKGRTAVR